MDDDPLIANDLVRAVEDGRFPLVLTDRTDLNVLAERVAARIKNILSLKGGMGRKTKEGSE